MQDFENDVKLLRKVLTYAVKKKKNLTCEKCGATKRSANGFISHMQFCGKSWEVSIRKRSTYTYVHIWYIYIYIAQYFALSLIGETSTDDDMLYLPQCYDAFFNGNARTLSQAIGTE